MEADEPKIEYIINKKNKTPLNIDNKYIQILIPKTQKGTQYIDE